MCIIRIYFIRICLSDGIEVIGYRKFFYGSLQLVYHKKATNKNVYLYDKIGSKRINENK